MRCSTSLISIASLSLFIAYNLHLVITDLSMPKYSIKSDDFLERYEPGSHFVLKLQLKQWYENPSPVNIMPPRDRVSGL